MGLIILVFILGAIVSAIVSAIIWRHWLLVLLAILSLMPIWGIGGIASALGSVHGDLYMSCWTCSIVGAALLLLRLKLKSRVLGWLGLALILVAPCSWIAVPSYDWWTKGRFEKIENRVDWCLYQPFSESNRLVKVSAPAELVFTTNGVPSVDCAYALYPIGAAAIQAQCPETACSWRTVRPKSSPHAYEGLFRSGPGHAVLALAPSTNQLAMAAEKGLSYEMTPIARDAFVFFVPVSNPISSLTSDQVRGIYSGRITTWWELGVDLNGKLIAFQRNPDSGSQTALERLMGETPIMPPIQENRPLGMGGVISVAADYRNYPGALGFSFRYYLQDLVKEDKVKILKIDGVEPTPENIRNGSYPFVETAYLITVRPRSENLRRLADFLTGPIGRDMIEKTGYILP